MSDYMFMLESHLTGEQSRALSEVRDAAEKANLNLFLTGGAMRDMMGGFAIRDLDFTVEGPAVKFARSLAEQAGAEVISVDETRKSVELRFPGEVLASIGMAHREVFPKPASKPQVQPSTIHEDLRCRDFTVDAIALSLGKASRGLLLDPANGLGDLETKELRAVSNHSLYDDPARILRMFRLKTRLGFTISERTLSQYANVREAKLDAKISPATWLSELRKIAGEPQAAEIIKTLDEEGLTKRIAPVFAGAKLNPAGLQKLQKTRQSLPVEGLLPVNWLTIVLSLLFEKLTPKERSQVASALGIEKQELDYALKLEARTAKLEKDLAKARITKPSVLYSMLATVPGETVYYLLVHSTQRTVLDRVRNYLQKYLPLAKELTDKDVVEAGGVPGTAKFEKLKSQLIASRLDARPKKPPVEEPPATPPPVTQGRRSSSFARSIT